MPRRPLVVGNWKMNLTAAHGRELARAVADGLPPGAVDVAVCPAFVHLFPVADVLRGSPVRLGAQDVFFESSGAYTGEVSPTMIVEAGATFVILGHSERRHTIGHLEDDWMINRKVWAALAAGLTPILCVGETLAQRDAGQTLDVLTFQLTAGLVGVASDMAEKLVVAYEPVWAIGTGRNASPAQAQEAHAHLRRVLADHWGSAAQAVRILYGGSVKPENARELLTEDDVDGGLIGGASLKAGSFLGIIAAALAAKG
jgi:triosephosphate isomerase